MLSKFKQTLYLASIVVILCAFNFAHNLTSGWQRQDLPNLNGMPLSGILFLDSLTGFAITANGLPNDSGYILKTTNSGFNWSIIRRELRDFNTIQFVNNNTGFVCGGLYDGAILYKTTNAGLNWFSLNTPGGGLINLSNMSVLNEDTIWVTETNSKVGGVFRTTNGGQNWVRQFYSGGTTNPDKVYFFNKNLGFFSRGIQPGRIFRTNNGGNNWTDLSPETGFIDIFFKDSLTGWKARGTMKKTTDGGLNWINQHLPIDKNFMFTGVESFSYKNDTIWAAGANKLISPTSIRGILYFTSNGGTNWGYQIPDTNINRYVYNHIQFLNPKTGWAYYRYQGGIYTTSGGNDTIIYTGIKNISSEVPSDYKLEQNYPNPFNPATNIKFNILKSGFVNISVYDINGRLISTLVNENLKAGEYKTDFNATGLSSGVYFYTLSVNNFKETKKMVLLK